MNDTLTAEAPTTRRTKARTMLAALDEQAERYPDDPFLVYPDDQIETFGTLRKRAVDFAAGLVARGFHPGERIAFLSENRPELITLTFGAAYAGMITVPVNVFLKGEFLHHQMENSGPSIIAVDAVGLAAINPMLARLHGIRAVILLEPDLVVEGYEGDVLRFADVFADGEQMEPYSPRPLEEFLILYTSGTTGASKGCVLSHAYMVRVGNVMTNMLEITDEDRQICVHPMFHMSGQMDLSIALITGTPMGVEPHFSASRFFPRAKELKATYWGGPGISDFLLTQPATKDHNLTRWIGTPFSPESETRLFEDYGIRSICQMYAQTEANPVATVSLSRPAPRQTDGRLMEDIECIVVDEDDYPVPVGEVGEIVLRPRVPGAMFSGYWNDSERTVEGWRNLWHHTGDFGRFDADGFITFVDRKKDSLRRKGENISAMELERVLLRFDAIAEVAVIGVRAPGQAEDDVKACIVTHQGADFDQAAFAAFATENVPRFAIPRYYELLHQLPRNPIGRVQKFELRTDPFTDATVDLFALGLATDRAQGRVVHSA